MRYGRCGNFDVGDTVHRVGEMVQQVGEAVQPSWRHRFIKMRHQANFGLNIIFQITLPLRFAHS